MFLACLFWVFDASETSIIDSRLLTKCWFKKIREQKLQKESKNLNKTSTNDASWCLRQRPQWTCNEDNPATSSGEGKGLRQHTICHEIVKCLLQCQTEANRFCQPVVACIKKPPNINFLSADTASRLEYSLKSCLVRDLLGFSRLPRCNRGCFDALYWTRAFWTHSSPSTSLKSALFEQSTRSKNHQATLDDVSSWKMLWKTRYSVDGVFVRCGAIMLAE